MATEHSNDARRSVAEEMRRFPDPIESELGQARIDFKAHDPSFYTPALVPGVRPYCHACQARVDRDGCAPYLTAKAKLDGASARRWQR